MPALALTKSYLDGEILLEADLDNIKDGIETFLNTTKIDDDNIQNAGITASSKLIDETITTAKLADSAITTAKIASEAVTPAKMSAINNGIIGEVKMFHTFNGAVSIPRGWMKLNGAVVNSTNYEAIHGVGTYTTDGVGSAALAGKNLPDMTDKFPIGVASTTQSGSSAITYVGNSGNTIDISHTHTLSHSHKAIDYTSTSVAVKDGAGNTLTSGTISGTTISANQVGMAINIAGSSITDGSVHRYLTADVTTDTYSSASSSAGSASQSIKPHSCEFIYIMKVV